MLRRRSLLHSLLLIALLASLAAAPLAPGQLPAARALPPAAPADHTPDPGLATLVGSLQTEIGCAVDWDPACSASALSYDANDDVWQGAWTLPAGNYEYKVALNGLWDENYGANAAQNGANIALSLAGETSVKFYYDHKSHWITDNRNHVIATIPGTIQLPLGCSEDWDPGCLRTWLQDADGDGIYTFSTSSLPAGSYEVKVAINESWDENYGAGGVPGGPNIGFSLPAAGTPVSFSYSHATKLLDIQVGSGGAGHDNNIFWADLGHNSRDPLYRHPGGPVTTGTPVMLRLRAASNDLTAAQVRIWNDRTNTQLLLPMARVADDGQFEWWQATVPASAEPTIYWYRFIAIDGTASAFYEDDNARTGGWGETFGSSPDNSWQLTVYDPAFQTPDWVKNGIIYQIFPDRFRDGDPGNNTPAGTFFYDEPGGTIVRSLGSDWNTVVCDPRQAGPCAGTWSKNFYGGDLQGILDKLDYLQDLGVSVLYLNPIFLSPSNHKYDTTDYGLIDPHFGDLALFQQLAAGAASRGMRVVLDGVFNHTSSDSVYFDRYGRYPAPDGACESEASPYRDWYYFHANPAGPCAGPANYESWFGFDSLPKLNAANQEVRDLIWAGSAASPTSAIARYWIEQGASGWRLDVGGDVDPGTTNDPDNDYWEGFRAAVRAADPEAYIVGEEWGLAGAWTLGTEWDATMNYQLGAALLSFWRDTPYTDNDFNPGSSAGPLNPLAPSQLAERLHNLAERYPPEAFYAMMNLLGSHDTNRALFVLDHNAATGTDRAPLLDPNYDWSDASERLQGVMLLQMTLPGAPTIYYGDEVGLVGPPAYDNGKWEDDPYNRQPYPWLDETGTPFYAHLQTQAGQDLMRDYVSLLAAARHSSPALRIGSFDGLLVDDGANVYAYGRRMPDFSDAAVVVVNRANSAQPVTVDVSGYLPLGAQFVDVLGGNTTYTVDAAGLLTIPSVPARSGALLLLDGALAAPPDAVADLAVTGQRSRELDLAWSAASGADSYDVYRSLLSGGGYAFVANVAGTSFTDTGLANAVRYHYVVVSRSALTGLVSAHSNEANGLPQHDLSTAWFNLQWPHEIVHTISALNPTELIFGQIWIDGATGGAGPAAGIRAQAGYGPAADPPGSPSWSWSDMTFNLAVGNNDEYMGSLLPDQVGSFKFTTRWSSDGGATWFYTDRDGPPYDPNRAGDLTVVPSDDTTPPAAPQNLAVTGTTAGSISLAWDANTEPDLHGYELFREALSAPGYSRLATLGSGVVSYVDNAVATGETYNYYLKAVDTSFNRSPASNIATGTAEALVVAVTFNVTVPSFTPGTVYIAGNDPAVFGAAWNPSAMPMLNTGPNEWSITLDVLDGTALEYKFTRGSWETVEKEADGNEEIPNRTLTADFGSTGAQVISHTVLNWRDPLVVAHGLAPGRTPSPAHKLVTVTWSQAMPPTTSFSVTGRGGAAVAGSFSYDAATRTVTFTPASPLMVNTTYTVTVAGQTDVAGDLQMVPLVWTFRPGDH
jgi:glycosidase